MKDEAGIDETLDIARTAYLSWRFSPAHERSALLKRAASRLLEKRESFTDLIVGEAGKPVSLARAEIDRALGVLDWAAAEVPRYAGELLKLDASPSGRPGFGIHSRFPRGPVLAITPFNFPLNLVVHKIAPAVAAGCSIVVKPSPHTPKTARAVAALFEDGPRGLVQAVSTDDRLTAKMTTDTRIATISFTGSARVGWMIREQAPRKPVLLELGGNAWLIVTEDLDSSRFAAAARRITSAAYGYAGQSCISVQNVAVAESASALFTEALREATRSFAWGDPELEDVLCGPVIDSAAAGRIHAALKPVRESLDPRALTVAGPPEGDHHAWKERALSPTLVELDSSSLKNAAINALVEEEIFGPVMTVRTYSRLDEIIAEVNRGRYGLQAGVYTDRLSVAEKLYRELEVGGLVVNDVPSTRYDHQPYGGVKASGAGREGVRYAMDDFTESKFLALSSEHGL